MARQLLGAPPVRATLIFDPGGSFAHTYRFQGTDKGFIAGLMGWDTDDPRMPFALSIASQLGLEFKFLVAPIEEADHPNTVIITAQDASGRQRAVRALSIGGGMIQVTHVDGFPVDLRGDTYEVVVFWNSPEDGERAERWLQSITEELVSLQSQARPGRGMSIARLGRPLEELPSPPEGLDAVYLEPVLPVATLSNMEPPLFTSAEAMVSLAEEQGSTLAQVVVQYEQRRSGWPADRVWDRMERVAQAMREAVRQGMSRELPMMGGVAPVGIPQKMARHAQQGRPILGDPLLKSIIYSQAVMAVNNTMGIVVASPTAGAAGVVPGTVLGYAEQLGLSERDIARGLFAAAGIGLIIAYKATFGAEVAGCQAETGSAGAMAAAALVELAGGSAKQAVDAASMALQNVLGLICDPVAGFTEVPCMGKNALGVANAYAMAEMALAGVPSVIPFDEVAVAMREVGAMLPSEVRCTTLGGLAATPTGKRFKVQFLGRVGG
jgi:L-serine dehydratase